MTAFPLVDYTFLGVADSRPSHGDIWTLIFRMWDGSQRHLYRRYDEAPSIHQTKIYQQTETLRKKQYLEYRKYHQGIYCADCWQRTGGNRRKTPVLPMYRKHLVNEQGQPVYVVHMSQCPECWTIYWAYVGKLNYDIPALNALERKKRKRPYLVL